MKNDKIRIRLKAFDYRILDQSATEIVDMARVTNVLPDVVVGTFGKALASFGAFAATTRPTRAATSA